MTWINSCGRTYVSPGLILAPVDFAGGATVVVRVFVVRRPSIQVSRKPLHGSRLNFVGSSLLTISPEFCLSFFLKFLISNFLKYFFR